jgi:hypothetical protein
LAKSKSRNLVPGEVSWHSILLLCLVSGLASAKGRVLTYGSAPFELTGRLELQTFPGPPSYESIKDGDDIERGFYLKLDAPVDVVPKGSHPDVENAQAERNVRVTGTTLNSYLVCRLSPLNPMAQDVGATSKN